MPPRSLKINHDELAPFACDCDPPRAHGPHWRRVSTKEQAQGPDRDKFWKAVSR